MNPPSITTAVPPDWATVKTSALSCVMCGLCVPHCPTFAQQQNEAQGPRGRISLMLGLSDGRLTPDDSVLHALDACLSCRACEAACPSLVPYGQLIDDTRALLSTHTPPPVTSRQPWRTLRDGLLTHRQRMAWLWGAATALDRFVPFWRRVAGRLALALPPTLPRAYRRPITAYKTPPTQAEQRPLVALFIGCMGGALGADVSRAAEKVLHHLGFTVWTPPAQMCCGAMHQHGGDLEHAQHLRTQNHGIFAEAPPLAAIVVVNTACAIELARAGASTPVIELTKFLADIPDAQWPVLKPLTHALAIHLPCSQQRVLKQSDATERLLRRIPGITLHALRSNQFCCGAAGMHALTHPNEATALRAPALKEITTLNCAAVSSNIGCAAHLSVGLGQTVKHPVEWIAAALPAPKLE